MSAKIIGLRKEDKNVWERRVAMTPEMVQTLMTDHSTRTMVESFPDRAYKDEEYQLKGASLSKDLSKCDIILGIKEIPLDKLIPGKVHLFFSHTIKAQDYNMPSLQGMLDKKISLIDYEKITDSAGRRIVYFGNYAGLAGMIGSLHALGKRLKHFGYSTVFEKIKPAYEYADLAEAQKEISAIGEEIKRNGLGDYKEAITFGFSGYGNVSKGAQSILELLPFISITPAELTAGKASEAGKLYRIVFKEEDMVKTTDGTPFDLDIYYNSPEGYKSCFSDYLPHLDVLVNAIYWEEQYPRLVEKKWLKTQDKFRLKIICDISADVKGSVEITEKVTLSDNPGFCYDAKMDTIKDGYEAAGILVLAVDNLPTELPRDASTTFAEKLFPLVPDLINTDFDVEYEALDLRDELKKALICHQGKLTPPYEYLQKTLDELKK